MMQRTKPIAPIWKGSWVCQQDIDGRIYSGKPHSMKSRFDLIGSLIQKTNQNVENVAFRV